MVVGCAMCLRNHGHQSQIATCVVSWCSSKRSHTGDCELRAGLILAETQEKNKTDARTALVTHQCHGPAIVVGKERNRFVSYRGRVTKVAPECLGKARVAEQMSWHITTKEKTLFEHALDEENLSW